jgi:putative lipase involved disintegration of autophagic bodies
MNHRIVVSFQGTDTSRTNNTVDNIFSYGFQTPVSYCTGCNASTGYLLAFNEVKQIVVDEVKNLRQLNDGFQVVVTGHSLGGALSAIAALELRNNGIPVHAVSAFQKLCNFLSSNAVIL